MTEWFGGRLYRVLSENEIVRVLWSSGASQHPEDTGLEASLYSHVRRFRREPRFFYDRVSIINFP